MATRRPLALVSGTVQETPAADQVGVNGLDGVVNAATLTNLTYVPNANSLAQAPFTPLFHDVLAFNKLWGAPTYTVSTDGSTSFGAGTLDNKLFANKDAHTSALVADTTTRGARWQWNNANVGFSNGAWLVLGHAYGGSTAPTKTVTVESSTDGSAWTVRHTSSYASTEVPVWHFITGWGGAQYLRVTVVWTAGGQVKLTSMRLLTSRWGDQGGGPEYSLPITWSADGTMVGIGLGVTAPTSALQVTGNATISGTLTVGGASLQPLDPDLTAIAAITPANDDIIQRKAGAWTNRTIAQLLTDLGIAAAYQPLDGDLTAIAALTATTNNIIQSVAGVWASRTPTEVKTALAIAQADVTDLVTDLAAKQPLDGDLTAIAALAPTAGDVLTYAGSAWTADAPAGSAWSDRVETLTDSSSLTGNALSGLIQVGVCTALTQAAAVNPPSNGYVGAPYRYVLTASGGNRVVTPTGFAASTDNGSGAAVTVNTGKTIVIFSQYIGASGWLYGGYELLQ